MNAQDAVVGTVVEVVATGEVGPITEITAAFSGYQEFIVELAHESVGFRAEELEIVR